VLSVLALPVVVALIRRYVFRRPLDLLAMWSETRMVVYTAVTGALYFAVLTPFKWAVLVPGFSEVRPGVAIPLALSFLFGPAAAWGAGVGNLIGDFFGTLGPGSIPGFIGNFLLAYAPYSLTRAWGFAPTAGRQLGWKGAAAIAVSLIVAAFACATFIAWGLHILGLVPFQVLGPVIVTNNTLVGLVLGVPLSLLMLPRAAKWGVSYAEVMDVEPAQAAPTAKLGSIVFAAGAVGGWLLGMGAAWTAGADASTWIVGGAVAPAIGAMFVGIMLL
jgi:energy-coupling factor transport system substrate-specific component